MMYVYKYSVHISHSLCPSGDTLSIFTHECCSTPLPVLLSQCNSSSVQLHPAHNIDDRSTPPFSMSSDAETLTNHSSTNLPLSTSSGLESSNTQSNPFLSFSSDVESLNSHSSTYLSLSIMSHVESLDTHSSINPSLFTSSEVEVLSTHSREPTFCNSLDDVSFCSQAVSSAPDNMHERTLRDYTHLIHAGVGFIPEVDAQLVREANIVSEKDKFVVLCWDEMKNIVVLLLDLQTLEM